MFDKASVLGGLPGDDDRLIDRTVTPVTLSLSTLSLSTPGVEQVDLLHSEETDEQIEDIDLLSEMSSEAVMDDVSTMSERSLM